MIVIKWEQKLFSPIILLNTRYDVVMCQPELGDLSMAPQLSRPSLALSVWAYRPAAVFLLSFLCSYV